MDGIRFSFLLSCHPLRDSLYLSLYLQLCVCMCVFLFSLLCPFLDLPFSPLLPLLPANSVKHRLDPRQTLTPGGVFKRGDEPRGVRSEVQKQKKKEVGLARVGPAPRHLHLSALCGQLGESAGEGPPRRRHPPIANYSPQAQVGPLENKKQGGKGS